MDRGEKKLIIHLPTAGGVCRAPERVHVIGIALFRRLLNDPRFCSRRLYPPKRRSIHLTMTWVTSACCAR
jgi:hypothetical protein